MHTRPCFQACSAAFFLLVAFHAGCSGGDGITGSSTSATSSSTASSSGTAGAGGDAGAGGSASVSGSSSSVSGSSSSGCASCAPTCTDGIKNQNETAIDCGGVCPACSDGLACAANADCTSAKCDDLVCGQKQYGVWGLGNLQNIASYNAFKDVMNGFHFRFAWLDYETAAGTFATATIASQMQIPAGDGLPVGLMMIVAPNSAGNTPTWLFNAPYNVPVVTTSTTQSFPYYFDTTYKTRYFGMLDHLRADLAALAPATKNAVRFWQSAEGSTGDEGPYKGTPPAMYDITDPAWTAFKRDEVWSPMSTKIATDLPSVHFLVNQGNDGTNFQWALDNLPGTWMKAGQFTHFYNFPGEGPYATRLQSLRTSKPSEHRVRGELEGVTGFPWWTASPSQNTFSIVCSALHAGVDILNVSPSSALPNHEAYLFFDRYAGIRSASEGNVGFVALRDMLDLADTTRFSEATYGTLVAAADQTMYNTRKNNILNSGDPQALIDDRLTALLTNGKSGGPFVNTARIDAIKAAFPQASYKPIEATTESYNQDFGVNMIPGNYSLFVTQWSPNTTSKGVWRVGDPTATFGRFGRSFDTANGKTEMFFMIDPGLIGDAKYEVKIKVTAMDSSTGQWSLNYWNGSAMTNAGTVKSMGTGKATPHEFDLKDFVGGGHLKNATDFTLKHEGGEDDVFFVVEVERVAQGT